jgi:hypothetical protein
MTVRYCRRCQAETERNAGGACKACASAATTAWRRANPAKAKEVMAAHYAANRDAVNAASAAWRSANADKVKATKAAYRAAHSDEIKAKRAAYYAANKEKAKSDAAAWYRENTDKAAACRSAWAKANPSKAGAYKAAWRKANPEAVRVFGQNRKATKRKNGGVLSTGLSSKLFKLQRGKCACCGLPLGKNYHLDHIMPLALGGLHVDTNMQLLRQRCNNQKSAKHPVDFMQSRGFLL